jgi:hypothetical protein
MWQVQCILSHLFHIQNVATLLWPSVGVKPNTSKVRDLESSGTPECSELNSKAQNTSHWGVLGVIGKVLKRRYRKWPRIGHLNISSPSYEQKKGRESNWLSQPYFGQVWGEAQHLEKARIWSPPGLPNVQSSTTRVKTPHIGVFLVSLERSWNVDISKMPSHWQFGHLRPKLWAKEGPGVKLAVWLPTTKSRESMPSRHPIWACDMALERSRRGLHLRFRPRRDPSRQSRVMAVQSSESPVGTISGQFRDSISGVPGICATWM